MQQAPSPALCNTKGNCNKHTTPNMTHMSHVRLIKVHITATMVTCPLLYAFNINFQVFFLPFQLVLIKCLINLNPFLKFKQPEWERPACYEYRTSLYPLCDDHHCFAFKTKHLSFWYCCMLTITFKTLPFTSLKTIVEYYNNKWNWVLTVVINPHII